jgi:sigma-E factor negative regulatory protein RseC
MKRPQPQLEHIGLVKSVAPHRITISLIGAGCTACHHSLCMLGDSKAKEVEVPVKKNSFLPGQEVRVKINPASGYLAVVVLYLVPFLLMTGTLSVMQLSGYTESMAGLASLLILLPYFTGVYQIRNRLKSHCTIEVEKR